MQESVLSRVPVSSDAQYHDAVQEAIQEMKEWLKETGSPSCRIQKVQFSHELTLQKRTYDSFTIRR